MTEPMRVPLAAAALLALVLAGAARAADAPRDGALGVSAGLGYYAVLPDKILLAGAVTGGDPGPTACAWTRESGPGDVAIERPSAPITWARRRRASCGRACGWPIRRACWACTRAPR